MLEESVSNAVPSIWASMNSWFTPAVLFVLLNVMIGTIAFTSTLANQKQHHNQHQGSHTGDNPQQQQATTLARSPSVLQRLKSINFHNCRFQQPSFISAAHFKSASDVETNFDFEQNHQSSSSLESHSQDIFEQPNHEQEAIFGRQAQETQTQYYFDQIQEPKPQEMETHFVFQQNHEEQVQENGIGLDSQPAPEEVRGEDMPTELQSLDEVYSNLNGRHVQRSNSDTKPAASEKPVRLSTKMKKSASMKSAFNHFEADDIVEARRPATVKERVSKGTNVDDEEGVDAKADDFISKFKQQLKLQRIDSIIRYEEMINRGNER